MGRLIDGDGRGIGRGVAGLCLTNEDDDFVN
jgi:hypothetical protein